jgi:RHS repeat-associated protein
MTTDYYYNTDWKCVEERDSGETCPRKQYAYGIRGRNDLVARDNYRYNSSSGSPSCSSAGKERHYALTDAMGSVTAVASTAGAVVERYSYTAFGKGQVMTANFADRSMSLYDWQTRFHGESRDEETGYYNYGYRYYLPELGKWPSRDPIGERGGENLYAFVMNDGLNWWDNLGLKRGCEGVVTVGHYTSRDKKGIDDEFDKDAKAQKSKWRKNPKPTCYVGCGANELNEKARKGGWGIPGAPTNKLPKDYKWPNQRPLPHLPKDDYLLEDDEEQMITNALSAVAKELCKCCESVRIKIECTKGGGKVDSKRCGKTITLPCPKE